MLATLKLRAALLFARVGITGLALILITTVAVVQFLHIHGWQIGFIKSEGLKAKAERLERVVEGVKAAQIEAHRMADEARKAREEYHLAEQRKNNARLEEAMRGWNDDARRFVERDRLRTKAAGRASSRTPTPADRGDPESVVGPDPVPVLDEFVLVPVEDVYICTENSGRLLIAQEWAEGLNAPLP